MTNIHSLYIFINKNYYKLKLVEVSLAAQNTAKLFIIPQNYTEFCVMTRNSSEKLVILLNKLEFRA